VRGPTPQAIAQPIQVRALSTTFPPV
jgi:hypothetical protein